MTLSSLTVLVPALNEEENLRPTVEKILSALRVSVEEYQVIIVNDGSTDRTADIAGQLCCEHQEVYLVSHPNRQGLGAAYATGIRNAVMSNIVYIPSDNTWPFRSFIGLFGNLLKADVVTSYSTNPEVRKPLRSLVSTTYTRVLNFLFGLNLHYFNGLTIYPTEFLQRHPPKTFGFGFQAEILLEAIFSGLSYLEIPLPITETTATRSKAVSLRNISSVLATLFRCFWNIRLNRAFRKSSLAFPYEKLEDEITAHPACRVVVITGASSGIGKAIVDALSAEPCRIYSCARSFTEGERVFENGAKVATIRCDVSDQGAVQRFFEHVKSKESHIDTLINCAGGFGEIGSVELSDPVKWLETLTINLFGPYLMVKAFLPLIARSTGGRIINFSGGGAFAPFPNYSAYACSKAAVVRFTETLAQELLGKGIAVNAVAPGMVATPAHASTLEAGIERAGRLHYQRTVSVLEDGGYGLQETVNCVKFLMSPEAHGLTGKTLSANFDPWATNSFRKWIGQITKSDLYTLRRCNIVNLAEGRLKDELLQAWANFGAKD